MYYKNVLCVSTWIWQLQQKSAGEVSRGLCSGSASRSGFIRVVIWGRAKIRAQGWWDVPGEHRFFPCFCCPRKSLARIILSSYSVATTNVRVAGMEVSSRKWPKYEENPPSSYCSRYMETWIPGDGLTLAWFSQTPMGLAAVLFSGGISFSSGIFQYEN